MSNRISLKNMLAEAFYYDVGTEKNEFESAVASATEAAKKKFEDSMKEKVLNQKVKIRASKGQPGQPEKDYIIDKVSSASVDWYWKQYVVVLKDEKNKEYFLKPGFKVEVLSAAAQPGQQQTQATPKEPPPEAQNSPTPVPGSASAPKGNVATPPMSADRAPKPKPPVAEGEGLDAVGGEYKKEWAAESMGEILWDFLSTVKQEQSQNNPTRAVLPYIKSATWVGNPSGDVDSGEYAKWLLEIPIEDMQPNLDAKELQLAITTGLRSSRGAGQEYTRGYGEVQKLGRFYRISVEYMVGVGV